MPLEHEYKYKVCEGVKYTSNEEQKIISLLKDVRENAALLRPDIATQRLDTILEVVEKGEWIIQDKVNPKKVWVEINNKIDLSYAKQIVDKYRRGSEGGCQSCYSQKIYSPIQGESFTYCSKRENETFAIDNWSLNNSQSPTIEKFSKTGCDEKEVKIKRKLEEVLDEHKSE